MKILQAESLKKNPPEKAGCGHLHQKTSFSAFAIVRDEEFLQSGRKDPTERRWGKNGAFTFFTVTPAASPTCDGTTRSSSARCHFHTFLNDPSAQNRCDFSNMSRVKWQERERMLKERRLARRGDKWELEVRKNAPLCRLKSLLSYKTTSPHQLRHVAPGGSSMWV